MKMKIVLTLFCLATIQVLTYCQNNLPKANNQFALQLWQKTKQDSSNLFISPLSIHVALNMAYYGSDGNTQNEIAKALGYPSKTNELKDYVQFMKRLNPKNDSNYLFRLKSPNSPIENVINSSLKKDTPQLRLEICNSLWYKKTNDWHLDYFEKLKQSFEAETFEINQDNATQINLKANEWVSNKTNGKISQMPTSFESNIELALVNVVYFNADWENFFEEKNTKKRNFLGINKVKSKVDFMKRVNQIEYYEDDDVKVIKLDYFSNLYSFIVILPHKKYGINAFENKFNTTYFDKIVKELKFETVDLSLPKFRIESNVDLIENLKRIGINEAFADNANFSKMTSKSLKIGKILHSTFIETSEKKTEAAALTLIEMQIAGFAGIRSEPPPPPKIVKADHPFLFLIKHNPTNTITFMGRFVKTKYAKY